MIWRRVVLATVAAAAVILSAPFVQQAFTAASEAWPDHFGAITRGATALPVVIALLFALFSIRDRRAVRYAALALAVAIGVSYTRVNSLIETETFHFVEYGLLGWLWYRASRPVEDASLVVVPMLAGIIVGTFDEWFQWFIPIRAGEARDVALNVVGSGCGLLVAIAVDPPLALTMSLRRESRVRVAGWAAAAVVVFALFFQTVHVGHDVSDPEIGLFRSRYTAPALASAARDRAARWSRQPPVAQRRLSREDHYLSEGLWHVQRRDIAWEEGDVAEAWRENRILEKFYAPILETPTYAEPAGHRWPAAQRDDAATRAGTYEPYASDAYAYPLFVWPKLF